ncbi:MAG TPA: hypothetical protein VJ553_00965 [Candidatus Paceibacterota bacterium]|nr:hypothetical protein [Candidatus Paceibacterota bacterium]
MFIIKQARRHFSETTDRDIAISAAWDRLEREALKHIPDHHKRRLVYNAIHNLYERRRNGRKRTCTPICTYPLKNPHS